MFKTLLVEQVPLKLQVVDLLDKRDVLVEDPLVLFLEVSLVILQLLLKALDFVLSQRSAHPVLLSKVHAASVLLRLL